MKRLAFALALSIGASTAALAADLPPPPPMPRAPATYIPVVPPYNWTGFYIGGNLGAGWTTSGGVSDTFGSTFTSNNNAQFLGGGQVGVNYEFWGGVVVGAEAMFDWLPNNSNTITATAPSGATASLSINNRWITTATGKLGYAWDRVLLYGKGGGAWVGSNSPGIYHGCSGCLLGSATPIVILAGPPVWVWSGHSGTIGQREPNGTTSD